MGAALRQDFDQSISEYHAPGKPWCGVQFFGCCVGLATVVLCCPGRIGQRRDRGVVVAVTVGRTDHAFGGTCANVIDRIRLGHVIDFIQVLIYGWPFPSFNVADSAITVGAALLIVDALFLSGRKTPASTSEGK